MEKPMSLFFGIEHGFISVQVALDGQGPEPATPEQLEMMVAALNQPNIKQMIKDRLLHNEPQDKVCPLCGKVIQRGETHGVGLCP